MGKKGLVIFFLLLIIRLSAQLPGYSYYKKLTTQESQITVGTTNLTNFPVLVRITDPELRHTSFGGNIKNTNGYDIQFTAADKTTLLTFQIEKYVQNTGELVAWVKVPTVSATINTDFYMFFGNAAIVTDPSATTTWDANYRAVWHFSKDRKSVV